MPEPGHKVQPTPEQEEAWKKLLESIPVRSPADILAASGIEWKKVNCPNCKKEEKS